MIMIITISDTVEMTVAHGINETDEHNCICKWLTTNTLVVWHYYKVLLKNPSQQTAMWRTISRKDTYSSF